MRLGVAIEETWDFFHEVYADFEAHHQTTLYERPGRGAAAGAEWRVNDVRFRRDFSRFLKRPGRGVLRVGERASGGRVAHAEVLRHRHAAAPVRAVPVGRTASTGIAWTG
jgi:hypothetical protein